MFQIKRAPLMGLLAAALLVSGGCGGKEPDEPQNSVIGQVSPTTAPAKGEADAVTWAVYRSTSSIDPIKAWDIPENLPVGAMCETLLTQNPDMSISAGLASSAEYVDDTTLVLELVSGATFWNGAPVTAEDVVYSLERARDPQQGGFYASNFDRVDSIEATADDEVTITLSKPDYWLRSVLSAMPGSVVEKSFAEQAGAGFGTAKGGVMCSGPFTFGEWSSGGSVVVERNEQYWDQDAVALVPSITFTTVSNDANLTAGFRTGDVDATMIAGSSVYHDLAGSDDVTVTSGPSFVSDLLAIGDPNGPLGDEKVRQALSLAIDRQTYIDSVYSGQATVPRSISAPGTWGIAPETFEAALGSQAELTPDVEEAKSLLVEAGAEGETITMVVASGIATGQVMATVVKEAAESIGLKLEQKSIALDRYNELFYVPAARKGVDLFPTVNGPIAPDPGAFLRDVGTPEGIYNFTGWSDDEVTSLLERARETADDEQRAELEAQADTIMTAGLPQIPLAHPYNVLYTSKDLTGAPPSYSALAGHFANLIGASE
jgi:peptide/nickel transport system substrate-binding protein